MLAQFTRELVYAIADAVARWTRDFVRPCFACQVLFTVAVNSTI